MSPSLAEHIEEQHFSQRMNGLRAAVLGANDGIISVVSLLIGVMAAGTDKPTILLVGLGALIAGAISMAAGEYVSVQSQADTEKADLAVEKASLDANWNGEMRELAAIYQSRGVSESTALQVARELMEHDALSAHAIDELGLTETHAPRPIQAAAFSAAAFIAGGVFPFLLAWFLPNEQVWLLGLSALVVLFATGALAAYAGGANRLKGGVRVMVWGLFAMLATYLIGSAFGVNLA
ncbi:MAG: VIT family protein [Pseudomonadota bacterium]